METQEQALAFLEEKRREHWDAAHNVYAYVLRGGFTERYSDDGEPQGTAGVPVLEVIKKSGVTDVCVIVTRYFGGVLLGAGAWFARIPTRQGLRSAREYRHYAAVQNLSCILPL